MIIKNRPYVLDPNVAVVNLSFSGTSDRAALPTHTTKVDTIRVAATKDCYFKLGNSTVTVTTNDGVWLPAGVEYTAIANHTYIAAIQDTMAGKLNIAAAR